MAILYMSCLLLYRAGCALFSVFCHVKKFKELKKYEYCAFFYKIYTKWLLSVSENILQMQSLQRSENCASVCLLWFPLSASITTHFIQPPLPV